MFAITLLKVSNCVPQQLGVPPLSWKLNVPLATAPAPGSSSPPSLRSLLSWAWLFWTRHSHPGSGSCVCQRPWRCLWMCGHPAACTACGSWCAAASWNSSPPSATKHKVIENSKMVSLRSTLRNWRGIDLCDECPLACKCGVGIWETKSLCVPWKILCPTVSVISVNICGYLVFQTSLPQIFLSDFEDSNFSTRQISKWQNSAFPPKCNSYIINDDHTLYQRWKIMITI